MNISLLAVGSPENELCCEKSGVLALQHKDAGNDYFKRHHNAKALQCYTKALLLAPYGVKDQRHFLEKSLEALKMSSASKHRVAESLYSMETAGVVTTEEELILAQCFGNRSATFYEMGKYNECLLDIDRALNLGLTSSRGKLERRRERCQSALLKTNENGVCDSVVHRKNVFESDAISVSSSPDAGRYTIANRDIHPGGEIIVSEEPYAAVLDMKYLITHCSFCFKKSPFSLLPCVFCPLESYCSTECMERAWVKYHWMECKVASHWRKNAHWVEVMSLRIVVSSDPGDVLNGCQGITPQGEYGFIYDLATHSEEFSNDKEESLLTKMAENITRCFGKYILRYAVAEAAGSDQLKTLFFRHLLQLRCNTHAVSEIASESESGLKDGEESSLISGIETVKEVKLGSVILPTASLINHSCSPNAIFRFLGNKVLVCTTKIIRKSEEINTSYGPQVGRMKTARRKKELLEKYFFNCQCVACTGSDPHLLLVEAALGGLRCPQCGTGTLAETSESAEDTSPMHVCCQCQARLSEEDLSKQVMMKERAEMLYELATNDTCDKDKQVNLELLLECEKIQTLILHEYNQTLARTHDTLAQLYASLGDFVSSSQFLELSCNSVAFIYGEESIEYGNEMTKMASVLFHSGRTRRAVEITEKARTILCIYYGSDYTDCKHLDEMIAILNSRT